MFFGPCFQVEAIVDGFTTNNNLLKLLSSYDCCSQNNYFSKNHKHKRTLREAFKKITILLLTFVNKCFTPPPLFIDENEKPLYKKCL